MYEFAEYKIIGKLRMQNAKGNEILAAPMYDENPNQMHPQVHIVNNPMPNVSNLSDPLRNDPKLVYPLGNVPPNFNASTNGNAAITSSTSLKNSINGTGPNTSNDRIALNIKENAHYPHLKYFL